MVLDLGRMLDLGISNGTAVAVGLGARKKKWKKKLRMRVRSRRRRRPTVAWRVSSVYRTYSFPEIGTECKC